VTTTSRSWLRGSDVNQRENSILTADHTAQLSHDQTTASGGLATPDQPTNQPTTFSVPSTKL